ncbi:hypothetical protein ABT023_22655 [Micromonospora sp. NPDC002296]|uniref:hypothetical protein n=1 Tax=Micromonospora sp. NPDC002296 TaxID=3154271 RepID=UPI003316AFDA
MNLRGFDRDSTQVEPLIPGSPSCVVLVAARNELPGLYLRGARLVRLDVLDAEQSRRILVAHLGVDRVEAEPDAAAELVGFCAGLPLAINVVAIRLATRPALPLRAVCAELRVESARLDGLDSGDLSGNVRAVISWSYRGLDDGSARMLRLLGVAPGPDISLTAAARLTAEPVARARALLGRLENAHLVYQHRPGRYRMHDLIRLLAIEQAGPDSKDEVRRLIDFYLHTALSGAKVLDPHRRHVDVGPPVSGAGPLTLTETAEARDCFQAEYACLLAAARVARARHWHLVVWQLVWALTTQQRQQGHLHDYIATWEMGLAAAGRRSATRASAGPSALRHRHGPAPPPDSADLALRARTKDAKASPRGPKVQDRGGGVGWGGGLSPARATRKCPPRGDDS